MPPAVWSLNTKRTGGKLVGLQTGFWSHAHKPGGQEKSFGTVISSYFSFRVQATGAAGSFLLRLLVESVLCVCVRVWERESIEVDADILLRLHSQKVDKLKDYREGKNAGFGIYKTQWTWIRYLRVNVCTWLSVEWGWWWWWRWWW